MGAAGSTSRRALAIDAPPDGSDREAVAALAAEQNCNDLLLVRLAAGDAAAATVAARLLDGARASLWEGTAASWEPREWRRWRSLGPAVAGGYVEFSRGGGGGAEPAVVGVDALAPADGSTRATAIDVAGSAFAAEARRLPLSAARRPKWLFVIRHAESSWNRAMEKGDVVTMLTRVDHPLSSGGVAQATALGARIRDAANGDGSGLDDDERAFLKSPEIWASPLRRSVQTALLALHGHGAAAAGITLAKDLREVRGYGRDNVVVQEAIGGVIAERARADLGAAGAVAADVGVDAGDAAAPWWSENAEDGPAVERRLGDLLGSLCFSPAESSILVTHSNLLRALFRAEAPPDIADAFGHRKLDNCGVVAIEVDFSARDGSRVKAARLLFGSELAADSERAPPSPKR